MNICHTTSVHKRNDGKGIIAAKNFYEIRAHSDGQFDKELSFP